MKRLIILLRIGAIGGLFIAIAFSIVIAGFATDAPGTPIMIPILVGCGMLIISTLLLSIFPCLALRRVKYRENRSLFPATLYGILSLIVLPPLGTLLGVLILLQIYKIRRSELN